MPFAGCAIFAKSELQDRPAPPQAEAQHFSGWSAHSGFHTAQLPQRGEERGAHGGLPVRATRSRRCGRRGCCFTRSLVATALRRRCLPKMFDRRIADLLAKYPDEALLVAFRAPLAGALPKRLRDPVLQRDRSGNAGLRLANAYISAWRPQVFCGRHHLWVRLSDFSAAQRLQCQVTDSTLRECRFSR